MPTALPLPLSTPNRNLVRLTIVRGITWTGFLLAIIVGVELLAFDLPVTAVVSVVAAGSPTGRYPPGVSTAPTGRYCRPYTAVLLFRGLHQPFYYLLLSPGYYCRRHPALAPRLDHCRLRYGGIYLFNVLLLPNPAIGSY